jgi:hypothetical protein
MVYIGIDISKLSTALCIERNGITKLYNYTTVKSNNIWIKETTEHINYRFIEYNYKDIKDYSEREVKKFGQFEDVSELIVNDIFDNIKLLDSIKIGIEGFSYGSAVGPIIDLVEMSTLIKHKIKQKIQGIVKIRIISPLSLKVIACEDVYGPKYITKGKRVIKKVKVIQGPTGKLGKEFDKKDMCQMFIDSKIDIPLKEHLNFNKEKVFKNKKLPKPFDDIIDSIFLKEVVKKI